MSRRGHWSDCAVHNEPAYPAGPCDCGGLDFPDDPSHGAVAPRVTGAGGLADLKSKPQATGFNEPHKHPTHRLVGNASAANLPDAHDVIPVSGHTNSVDLDDA